MNERKKRDFLFLRLSEQVRFEQGRKRYCEHGRSLGSIAMKENIVDNIERATFPKI